MSYPIVSSDPEKQAFYESMRDRGESHAIAEVCALQAPPGIGGTDSIFLQGHCCGNQFADQPKVGNTYKRKAEAAGVSTTGKVYLGSLARFPGDPEAWVSGRGDVKRVLDKNNWSAEGAVSRQAVRGIHDTGNDVDVAADILDRETRRELAATGASHADADLVRARVRKRLSARASP